FAGLALLASLGACAAGGLGALGALELCASTGAPEPSNPKSDATTIGRIRRRGPLAISKRKTQRWHGNSPAGDRLSPAYRKKLNREPLLDSTWRRCSSLLASSISFFVRSVSVLRRLV